VQAPKTQAWPVQVVGVRHSPLEPHVSIWVSDEHWVAVGVHTPVQAPAEQTNGHAVPETHCPEALQVWGTGPEHWFAPGMHEPVQPPAEHT
jgi:hypothetical protein